MVSPLFLNQLSRLDRTLYVKLDRTKQRFVVWRRDRTNLPREILVVHGENGEFCYPSYETIAQLYKMDSWQNKNLIADMDRHNAEIDRESVDRVRRMSIETSKLITRSQYY